jgi:hypothetical protein
LHAASSPRTVRFLVTSKPVRLSILWEDDAATIREFPSKAAAIDWLATHDTDRPMHSCHIVPVEQRVLTDEQLTRIPPHKRVTKDRTLEQARRERFEASERLKGRAP